MNYVLKHMMKGGAPYFHIAVVFPLLVLSLSDSLEMSEINIFKHFLDHLIDSCRVQETLGVCKSQSDGILNVKNKVISDVGG